MALFMDLYGKLKWKQLFDGLFVSLEYIYITFGLLLMQFSKNTLLQNTILGKFQ